MKFLYFIAPYGYFINAIIEKKIEKVSDQGTNNQFPNETGEAEKVGQVRN